EPGMAVTRPIPLAIQPKHALHLGHRHGAQGRSPPPPVEQPIVTIAFVMETPAAHGARTHTEPIGHRQPALPSAQRSQNHVLRFHGPLHCSRGVGHSHLLGGNHTAAACSERSDHLLSGADKSCTPDTEPPPPLDTLKTTQ